MTATVKRWVLIFTHIVAVLCMVTAFLRYITGAEWHFMAFLALWLFIQTRKEADQ